MTRVQARNTAVLIRESSTTTYHFGLSAPICEETPSDAPPVQVTLRNALESKRRLCRLCANLVEKSVGAALSEASATHVLHPTK